MDQPEYRASLLNRVSNVSEAAWNALLPEGQHPFLQWKFFNALEESGCTGPGTGWQPLHVWLEDADGAVIGAAPLYGKSHSQGEYVFDHGWADALHRAGIEYYPKLALYARHKPAPFSPNSCP